MRTCIKCGGTTAKWGLDRSGRDVRQRYRCHPCNYIFLEPREYPLGEEFQSEPKKLLHAISLMESGNCGLGAIAKTVGLDRYTIYKLNNHLGRMFQCQCGRELGHRGNCPQRQNEATVASLNSARLQRKYHRPEWEEFRRAKHSLMALKRQLKEIEIATD